MVTQCPLCTSNEESSGYKIPIKGLSLKDTLLSNESELVYNGGGDIHRKHNFSLTNLDVQYEDVFNSTLEKSEKSVRLPIYFNEEQPAIDIGSLSSIISDDIPTLKPCNVATLVTKSQKLQDRPEPSENMEDEHEILDRVEISKPILEEMVNFIPCIVCKRRFHLKCINHTKLWLPRNRLLISDINFLFVCEACNHDVFYDHVSSKNPHFDDLARFSLQGLIKQYNDMVNEKSLDKEEQNKNKLTELETNDISTSNSIISPINQSITPLDSEDVKPENSLLKPSYSLAYKFIKQSSDATLEYIKKKTLSLEVSKKDEVDEDLSAIDDTPIDTTEIFKRYKLETSQALNILLFDLNWNLNELINKKIAKVNENSEKSNKKRKLSNDSDTHNYTQDRIIRLLPLDFDTQIWPYFKANIHHFGYIFSRYNTLLVRSLIEKLSDNGIVEEITAALSSSTTNDISKRLSSSILHLIKDIEAFWKDKIKCILESDKSRFIKVTNFDESESSSDVYMMKYVLPEFYLNKVSCIPSIYENVTKVDTLISYDWNGDHIYNGNSNKSSTIDVLKLIIENKSPSYHWIIDFFDFPYKNQDLSMPESIIKHLEGYSSPVGSVSITKEIPYISNSSSNLYKLYKSFLSDESSLKYSYTKDSKYSSLFNNEDIIYPVKKSIIQKMEISINDIIDIVNEVKKVSFQQNKAKEKKEKEEAQEALRIVLELEAAERARNSRSSVSNRNLDIGDVQAKKSGTISNAAARKQAMYSDKDANNGKLTTSSKSANKIKRKIKKEKHDDDTNSHLDSDNISIASNNSNSTTGGMSRTVSAANLHHQYQQALLQRQKKLADLLPSLVPINNSEELLIYPDIENPTLDEMKEVRLSVEATHTAPQMKVTSTLRKINNTVSTDKGYRTTKATHGVWMGSWYFEVDILDHTGNVRLGLSQISADLQAPVGSDVFSYSIRDYPGVRFHNSNPDLDPESRNDFVSGFSCGDTVGFEIHLPIALNRPQMINLLHRSWNSYTQKQYSTFKFPTGSSFEEGLPEGIDMESCVYLWVNGKRIDRKAFKNLLLGKYYPTVSCFKGGKVRYNFGPEFKYPVPIGCLGYHLTTRLKTWETLIIEKIWDRKVRLDFQEKMKVENEPEHQVSKPSLKLTLENRNPDELIYLDEMLIYVDGDIDYIKKSVSEIMEYHCSKLLLDKILEQNRIDIVKNLYTISETGKLPLNLNMQQKYPSKLIDLIVLMPEENVQEVEIPVNIVKTESNEIDVKSEINTESNATLNTDASVSLDIETDMVADMETDIENHVNDKKKDGNINGNNDESASPIDIDGITPTSDDIIDQ